jgi:transposase
VQEIASVGMDIAKQVFQIHAADAEGNTLFNRKVRRKQVIEFFQQIHPCDVAMEACGSAYYWAREISHLGHCVKLIPPQAVKPFVLRGKTDANDALAISEAMRRKTTRFVPVKSAEQQGTSVLVGTRTLLIRQRTRAANALRSHLSEFGLITGLGVTAVEKLLATVESEQAHSLPASVRFALREIGAEVSHLNTRIKRIEKELSRQARLDADVTALMTIPGIGIMTALTIKAAVPDARAFKSARQFAAWLGLTPLAHASGNQSRSTGISKKGNKEIRALLFMCAMSHIGALKRSGGGEDWLKKLLNRKPTKVAIVALSNKLARIVWVIMAKGETYKSVAPTSALVISAA